MNHPEIIIVPTIFATIGFVAWVAITGWQRRQRLKLVTDFNSRLLDRLGSVKDFSEFLQTAAGAQFMDNLATDAPSQAPYERILRATQLGIVLVSRRYFLRPSPRSSSTLTQSGTRASGGSGSLVTSSGSNVLGR